MGRSVQVADGAFVALPNGYSYQNGETVTLTEDEWLRISPAVVTAGVLIDLGAAAADGDGFDFVSTDGTLPDTAADFQTLLQITPGVAAFETWMPNVPYAPGMIVEPTVRNNHAYKTTEGGTSGAEEPDFTTTGDDVIDNDITWADFDTVDDFGPPDPSCNIFVWLDGAWKVAFTGAWAGGDTGFGGTRLSNSGTIFNTAISSTDVEVTKYAFEIGTVHFEQHDLFGTLINQVRFDQDVIALAAAAGDAIKVGGAQRIAFYDGDGVEGADVPTADTITDLDALVAYLINLGLLQPAA